MDETTAVDLGTEKLNRYALPVPDKAQAADAVKASLALLDLGPDKVMAPQLCATYRAPLPLQPEIRPLLSAPSGSRSSPWARRKM